jgi:hypothetical protein
MPGVSSLVLGVPILWYLTNSFWFALAFSLFVCVIWTFMTLQPPTTNEENHSEFSRDRQTDRTIRHQ